MHRFHHWAVPCVNLHWSFPFCDECLHSERKAISIFYPSFFFCHCFRETDCEQSGRQVLLRIMSLSESLWRLLWETGSCPKDVGYFLLWAPSIVTQWKKAEEGYHWAEIEVRSSDPTAWTFHFVLWDGSHLICPL